MPTAAALIIGNEILTGKFPDENGPFLIRRFREMGVDLRRLLVIPDELPLIAEEVRHASLRHDHVLTTGGIGPTHDDLTYAGVADAFGRPLHRHPELVALFEEKLGERCNEAALRMAEVPAGAELWWDGGMVYPVVVVENVAIFPGVPPFLKLKFEAIALRFGGVPIATRRLSTRETEVTIAATLTEAAERWPTVDIGSYPRFEEQPNIVIVTMEGRDLGALDACDRWLREHIPVS